jgi:hypothetical protein
MKRSPNDFIFVIAEFLPDFGVTSVNYDVAEFLARAEAPR